MASYLVPENDEGNAVCVIVGEGHTDAWIDLMPAFLREQLMTKVPADGKQYVARISWTIGGV